MVEPSVVEPSVVEPSVVEPSVVESTFPGKNGPFQLITAHRLSTLYII